MTLEVKMREIHRHTGGLENYWGVTIIMDYIHRHTGGLEIIAR